MLTADAGSDIRFSGVLTDADVKRNIPHPIAVPPGITRLQAQLDFSPAEVAGFKNHIALTIIDPRGFRGAGHRHGSTHVVDLGPAGASPGYFAGPIPPGDWTIVLDTHMIMPGEAVHYQLRVSLEAGAALNDAIREPADPPFVARPQPGWYRGDLHAHTRHSDARWDVPDLVAWARARRLDFTSLTDHSTVSGLPHMLKHAAPDLLTMGGMECTTFWGHALALGVHEWVDWRTRPGRGMPEIAAEVTARGGTFIIAHPMAIGDPYCTGCRWVYPDFRPGTAHAVEVWNTQWANGTRNEDALALAFSWLNAGHRFALTAGTDNHGTTGPAHFGFNVVQADALSEAEILRGVRRGHLYISAGPALVIEARAGGTKAMMGDTLAAGAGPVDIVVAVSDAPNGATLDLIADGDVVDSLPVADQTAFTWQLTQPKARWCLVTLRAADGLMLALTNPIFLGR